MRNDLPRSSPSTMTKYSFWNSALPWTTLGLPIKPSYIFPRCCTFCNQESLYVVRKVPNLKWFVLYLKCCSQGSLNTGSWVISWMKYLLYYKFNRPVFTLPFNWQNPPIHLCERRTNTQSSLFLNEFHLYLNQLINSSYSIFRISSVMEMFPSLT